MVNKQYAAQEMGNVKKEGAVDAMGKRAPGAE